MSERIAPANFIEELHRIESSLSAEWSDKHKRWLIAQIYDDGSKHYILCVADENNEYMDLDNRTLIRVNTMFFKNPDIPDAIEYMEKENEKLETEKQNKFTDKISDITSYNWHKINEDKIVNMPATLKEGINDSSL